MAMIDRSCKAKYAPLTFALPIQVTNGHYMKYKRVAYSSDNSIRWNPLCHDWMSSISNCNLLERGLVSPESPWQRFCFSVWPVIAPWKLALMQPFERPLCSWWIPTTASILKRRVLRCRYDRAASVAANEATACYAVVAVVNVPDRWRTAISFACNIVWQVTQEHNACLCHHDSGC